MSKSAEKHLAKAKSSENILVLRDSKWALSPLDAAKRDELCALECPHCHAIVGQPAAIARTGAWCPVCAEEHTHVYVVAGMPLTLTGSLAIARNFSQLLIPNCPHCEERGISHDPSSEAWLEKGGLVHIEDHEVNLLLDASGMLDIQVDCELPDIVLDLLEDEREKRCLIVDRLSCVVDDSRYFIAGTLPLPVRGRNEPFSLGIWAEVDSVSFNKLPPWGKQLTDVGFSGFIANEVGPVPGSKGLKVSIRVSSSDELPEFYLDPTDHPLGADQANGLDPERVSEYTLDASFTLKAVPEKTQAVFGSFKTLALTILCGLLPERTETEDPSDSWYQVLASSSNPDSAIILCSMDYGTYHGVYAAGVSVQNEDSSIKRKSVASSKDVEQSTEVEIPAGYSALSPKKAFERLGLVLCLLNIGKIKLQSCVDFKLSELSEEFIEETQRLKQRFDDDQLDSDMPASPDSEELENFFNEFSKLLFKVPSLRWDVKKELKNAPRIQVLNNTKYPKALLLIPSNVFEEDSAEEGPSNVRIPSVLFIPSEYTKEEHDKILKDLHDSTNLSELSHPSVKAAFTRRFKDLSFEQARTQLRAIASGEQEGCFH